MLDSEVAVNIKNAENYFAKPHIKNDLVYICSNFINLPISTTQLQTQRVSSTDSIEIVENVFATMKCVTGTYGANIFLK